MHNPSMAVFLVSDLVRAVACTYDIEIKDGKPNPDGKHVLFKTTDNTLKVDDLVVVPTDTRHGFTIVKVVSTNVDIDMDNPTPLKWVAGKFDLDKFRRLESWEADVLAQIRQAEKRKQREDLKAKLEADVGKEIMKLAPPNGDHVDHDGGDGTIEGD